MATKIRKTSNGGIPVVATVQASRSTGVTSLTVDTQQFWPSGSTIDFSTYKTNTSNARIAGTQTDWTGISNGTTTLSSLVVVGGAADAGNAIGDKVQMGPTGDWGEGLVDGILNQHNSDGTHAAITATSITDTGTLSAAGLISGAAGLSITGGTVNLPAGSLGFAALLSTIFSGQLQTLANAGTGGGTMYYLNLGGIKLCWGINGSNVSSPGGNTYTITLPPSFFTTIQAVTISAVNQVTNGGQSVSADSVSAVSILYKQVDPGGTGALSPSYLIIGA